MTPDQTPGKLDSETLETNLNNPEEIKTLDNRVLLTALINAHRYAALKQWKISEDKKQAIQNIFDEVLNRMESQNK